ncbi:MAG TPA: DCC1-like thiol-disulfide oxidoreductase family protein [Terriglobales bacterium]|nr:DCC1-like thiol-disulfide oxidoreductase family protein [Terriglobales bacterium]
MPDDSTNPVILYDGVCGLCNRTVQFILRRDRRNLFRFATLQSEFARKILLRHAIRMDKPESVCLVLQLGQLGEVVEMRSTAAISIGRELGAFWRVISNLFAIFPESCRDWGYDLVARYRYRVFGKYDTCPLPHPKDRHKFLDVA